MAQIQITVWMNQPSHYQTAFFHELASRSGIDLSVYYATRLTADRRALGWSDPGAEVFRQTVLTGARRYLVALRHAWHQRHAVHVINGVWSIPIFALCAAWLLLLGAPVYFHSERPNPATTRSGGWLLIKRCWTKLLMARARGIFVIGRAAGDYYASLGVPRAKLLPFMYFNQSPDATTIRQEQSDSQFTVVYVGQFIARKRVHDLIEAFSQLRERVPRSRLMLIGSGPLCEAYAARIATLGLSEYASIAGPLAPGDASRVIQRSSVLVLPSEFDGWGLAVNEALQAGVPAICTDACGASELLRDNPDWGLVYPAGDVDQLGAAMQSVAQNSLRFRPSRDEVEARIGVSAMTTRFMEMLNTGSR